jgi:hypothetical protein
VKNPDAPEHHDTNNDGDDISDVHDSAALEHADYIPDAHNQMPSDEDHNDGTGLTS